MPRIATDGQIRKRDTRSVAFVVALTIAVAGLLVLSYRSIRDLGRSTEMLADGRVEATLALLSGAVNRDMKGAQVSVLLPLELEDVAEEPPYDLRDTFAEASARFHYPESFFIAMEKARGQFVTHVFNRVDRLPRWDRRVDVTDAFPVVMRRDAEEARPLFEAVIARASRGSRFVVFDWTMRETPYQIVAKFFYSGQRSHPVAVVGFTVNLTWVEEHYFNQLAREVARIAGSGDSIGLAIFDPNGRSVASTATLTPASRPRSRDFLLLFFDPAMLSSLAPAATPGRPWEARVGIADDHIFLGAERATRWTYGVLAVAAITSVVCMLLTARLVRARAELADMQADFVSTVTHELKTPLQAIGLVGETLARGRYKSADTVREYSRMLSREVSRLTRLIDNLLTLARVSDQGRRYTFEGVDLADLIDDVLDPFRARLAELGFELSVDVPHTVPPVRGDRAALHRVLDNLIDNAIKYSIDKYSTEQRRLAIQGSVSNGDVAIEVSDRGIGIAPEEVPRIFDKFYRGRPARAGGSGLGLAIVKRIVEDHQGTIDVTSAPGQGTSVRLLIPSETVRV